MKLRILIAVALGAMVSFVPAPASAKGPTEVELTGPGLDEPILLDQAGHWQSAAGELISAAGLFEAFSYTAHLDLTADPPTMTLGSRYVAAYGMILPEGVPEDLEVRQELYPFAEGGPVVYTPPGQSMYGTQTTNGGWKRADPDLRDVLISVGVPSPVELDARRAPPVESADRGVPLTAGDSGAAGLLVAGALVASLVRRRRHRVAAS